MKGRTIKRLLAVLFVACWVFASIASVYFIETIPSGLNERMGVIFQCLLGGLFGGSLLFAFLVLVGLLVAVPIYTFLIDRKNNREGNLAE